MAKTAIVVHACGFESEGKICKAFKSRLRRTKLITEELPTTTISIVIITGGVRYRKGSELLANCGGNYLRGLFSNNRSPYSILYAVNCYNSSTDTQDVLKICTKYGIEKIVVVTSYWHNWMVRQMYKHWNIRLGPRVEFTSPRNRDRAGIKTIFKYAVFGGIVLASRAIGLFNWLDEKLNTNQAKRKEGFMEVGCD